MDLGVLLESTQGNQSSSRVRACTCTFLPSCSSSVALPFAWIKESVAFRRGFPTGLSHVPPRSSPLPPRSSPCKSKQCRENRILWNELKHLGDSWNGGTTHEFLSPFLCSAPPLEMRRKRRKFFPEEAEKDPSSRVWRRKRSSSGGGRTLVLPLEWRRVCRGTS